MVDVSGLDRVPLVDGDRADVSGRHAHAHTSAHVRPPNPAYTGNGCKVKLFLYNIGVFYSLYTPCDKSSPSIERGYWRPSRDPDSYGPRCIVHQAKAIRDVPTAGLRCGRCGFRGTAMSGLHSVPRGSGAGCSLSA